MSFTLIDKLLVGVTGQTRREEPDAWSSVAEVMLVNKAHFPADFFFRTTHFWSRLLENFLASGILQSHNHIKKKKKIIIGEIEN